MISRGDPDLGPHDRQLLDALDKGSYIGVPVIFDGRTWGKLEAFANVGAVPFTRRHVPFLEAIAGQVGAAIGRAELFSRVNALAYADPLTGLGNRRALDERLERAVERGGPLAIAFCDLDGLKQINDTHGHDAGDRAIRRAADALAAAARGRAGAYVYRVGGDEFCVVLEGAGAAAAAAVAAEAGRLLAAGGEPLALSCGVAALRPGARPADLFRAADAPSTRPSARAAAASSLAERRPSPAARPGRAGAPRATAPTRETRALAERLLAVIDGAPEAERVERLAARARAHLTAARVHRLPGWTSRPCARSSRCSSAPPTSTAAPTARCRPPRSRPRARRSPTRSASGRVERALRAPPRAAGRAARRLRAAC